MGMPCMVRELHSFVTIGDHICLFVLPLPLVPPLHPPLFFFIILKSQLQFAHSENFLFGLTWQFLNGQISDLPISVQISLTILPN